MKLTKEWMFKKSIHPTELIKCIDNEFKRADVLFERSSDSLIERQNFINTFFSEFENAINNTSIEIKKCLTENKSLDNMIFQNLKENRHIA